jgi:pimeloyl-ACP methyl ester carboxylesterase
MTAREEVLVDVGRGIELCYDQTGDPADPPILLIAGLGRQLHSWPTDFVAAVAGRGFRVTRFEEAVREYAGVAWDRDWRPAGLVLQLTGIFASGDRTAELRHIDVPTLVIHGDRDRMVHPTGGAATARAIPGARLETIVGLGHDLPIGAWGRIIDLIAEHATFAPVTHTELEEHA